MTAKMGINMIEMYCKMVKEQFLPITNTLNSQDMLLREQCATQAKKDLGIYEKMTRLAKLKLEKQTIELELKAFTESFYAGGNRHQSKVDQLTDEYLKQSRNGFHVKVREAMDSMIFKIRLSGLDGDTKKIFEELPAVVKQFQKELKKLPAPAKRLKKIS